MATRHKQQLASYLSRHKNDLVSQSTSKPSNPPSSSSVLSRQVGKTAAKPASVHSAAHTRPGFRAPRMAYSLQKNSTHDGCLPDEILLKIFTYLDVVSLIKVSQVCKRWCVIARDNFLWQRITQAFTATQKGKVAAKAADSSASFSSQWRDICIARCAAWRNERALMLVKKSRLNPFTGLPKDTEKALKDTGITFQLSLVDGEGKESCCVESSEVTLHKSSASVVWHSLNFLPLCKVRRLRLLAICPLFYNDKGTVVKGSPYQRSLLWEADVRLSEWVRESNLFTEDDLINMYHLPGDLLLATWKADGEIAFFAAGLHYNQLVQRCMLGTSVQCYEVPQHKLIPDDIDSIYGLHDYKVTVELRTLKQPMWSQQFSGLHCAKPEAPCRELAFTLVRHDSVVDHTPLEKHLRLPWRTELFKGTIENMAWLDVTVLDERGEIFFTASCAVKAVKPSVKGSDFEYEECKHLRIEYEEERASVHLQIGKISNGKTFVRHLELKIKTRAINEWFGTKYPTLPESTSSSSKRS